MNLRLHVLLEIFYLGTYVRDTVCLVRDCVPTYLCLARYCVSYEGLCTYLPMSCEILCVLWGIVYLPTYLCLVRYCVSCEWLCTYLPTLLPMSCEIFCVLWVIVYLPTYDLWDIVWLVRYCVPTPMSCQRLWDIVYLPTFVLGETLYLPMSCEILCTYQQCLWLHIKMNIFLY